MTSPPLWNACDFVLQYIFTIAHIPGKTNNAADLLSRLEMDPHRRKVRVDFPTKPIERNIEPTGNAQEEPFFFETTNQHETTEKRLWKRIEERRKAIPDDPPVIMLSRCYEIDLQKDTAIVKIAQLTKPSRRVIEQDSATLLIFKLEMASLQFDKQIVLNDAR